MCLWVDWETKTHTAGCWVSKMAKHCSSPRSPNHLVCGFSYYPCSQYNLATSEEDLHVPVHWKCTWDIRNGAEFLLTGKVLLWLSQQDEQAALWLALNTVDLTCLQTASSMWAWVSLPWKSRCRPFSGCLHSSTSLYEKIQGQDCIVQDATQFCTQIEHRSLKHDCVRHLRHSWSLV